MNCTEFDRTIDPWARRRVDEATRAAFEAHWKSCASCDALMAQHAELPCREFTAFLDAWLDGELRGEERRVFERHLDCCADCKAFLDSYRAARELGRGAYEDEAPTEVPEQLVQAILDARRAR